MPPTSPQRSSKSCLDLDYRPPDSGERQYTSRASTRRFDPVLRAGGLPARRHTPRLASLLGGGACLLIRKHDHFTTTREIKRHVRAQARNHPEGWKLQGHVSPTTTNCLTYWIRLLVGAMQWSGGGGGVAGNLVGVRACSCPRRAIPNASG